MTSSLCNRTVGHIASDPNADCIHYITKKSINIHSSLPLLNPTMSTLGSAIEMLALTRLLGSVDNVTQMELCRVKSEDKQTLNKARQSLFLS